MMIQRTEMSMRCIQDLTMEEKIAFLKAFVRLARVDGSLDEEEANFIKGVASLYGLNESHKEDILAVDSDEHIIDAVKGIKNRRAAMELIKEMCMLAHADDVLSDDETLFIGKIGEAMGVELEKVEQISKWVIDRIIWLEEGKIIFEEV